MFSDKRYFHMSQTFKNDLDPLALNSVTIKKEKINLFKMPISVLLVRKIIEIHDPKSVGS